MSKIAYITSIITSLSRTNQVILTHGTYDLLHIGHIKFLEECKKQGGLLIVGVDHDSNTNLYKGTLPVMPQKERVRVISQLGIVDFVLPFPAIHEGQKREDFYFWLYAILRPQIIPYGTNFACQEILRKQCSELQIKDCLIEHQFSNLITSTKIRSILEKTDQTENKSLAV